MDMLTVRTNQEVQTPLGKGIVQAPNMNNMGVLVRLALSGSETDSRCVTPRAVKSSLWVFQPCEIKTLSTH